MAGINNIEKELNSKKMELLSIKKDIETVRSSLCSLGRKKEDLISSIDLTIRKEEEKLRGKVLSECSSDLEAQLSEHEIKLKKIKKEKKSKLEYFSFDTIKSQVISQSPVGEDLWELINELELAAYGVLGEHFVKSYFSMLVKKEVSESEFLESLDSLPEIKKRFYSCQENKLSVFFEAAASTMKKIELKGETKSMDVTLAMGMLMILLMFIVLPFYLLGLVGFFCFSIYRTYLIKKSLDTLMVVKENFRLMEEALEKRSKETYEKKQESIETEFNDLIEETEQSINKLSERISSVRQKAMADFYFDSAPIRKEFDIRLAQIDFSIAEQKRLETSTMRKIQEIEKEIKSLNQKYLSSVAETVNLFIGEGKIGDSMFYPEKFLITDQEPLKYYQYTTCSNFFVYKDIEMVNDFIRLLCYQLRALVAPSMAQIQIWDIQNSGTSFMPFMNSDVKTNYQKSSHK